MEGNETLSNNQRNTVSNKMFTPNAFQCIIVRFHAADATRAGSGDLRVKVLHEGVEVRSRVYMEQNGLYKVDFTPEGSGSYSVEVYFNDEIVRGRIW